MGLKFYFDAAGTQEITDQNPDTIHKAVVAGANMVDERSLWIRSDDPALTYENISITAQNKPANVTVQYAKDNNGSPGTYADSIALPNGTFDSAVRFWRKIVVPNVNEAQKITVIKHCRTYDEYVI
jgi:hypothetical protein